MRTPDLAALAFAPLVVPAHAATQHLFVDSVLGVAVGVVAVFGYVLALRWVGDDGGESGGGRGRRSRGTDDRRSNR